MPVLQRDQIYCEPLSQHCGATDSVSTGTPALPGCLNGSKNAQTTKHPGYLDTRSVTRTVSFG